MRPAAETQPLHEAAHRAAGDPAAGGRAPQHRRPPARAPPGAAGPGRAPSQRVLHTSPVPSKPSASLVASVRSNSRPAT